MTTERACVCGVVPPVGTPVRRPVPAQAPHLFLRGPPRTRPLSLRGPAVPHRARAWPLPAAAHVVEPGAARGPEERTGQAAGRRGRARETQPGRPPARAPTFPLSEGGDTPRASPPRRQPRPLAAALGTHPGHAGQPVWTPLPPLGARGRQRTVSPRAPGHATLAPLFPFQLPASPGTLGSTVATPRPPEPCVKAVPLVSWWGGFFLQVCPLRHLRAFQHTAKKCRMHALIYFATAARNNEAFQERGKRAFQPCCCFQ